MAQTATKGIRKVYDIEQGDYKTKHLSIIGHINDRKATLPDTVVDWQLFKAWDLMWGTSLESAQKRKQNNRLETERNNWIAESQADSRRFKRADVKVRYGRAVLMAEGFILPSSGLAVVPLKNVSETKKNGAAVVQIGTYEVMHFFDSVAVAKKAAKAIAHTGVNFEGDITELCPQKYPGFLSGLLHFMKKIDGTYNPAYGSYQL